ncbi:hypothetical protein LTR92_011313 [Exophiala xenobiotica]|nr:hypothetical protein LTR92_011313 [Exophiala xenobiotica]
MFVRLMCAQIADICIFAFFMTLGILRVIIYPRVARTVVDDFSQTSYLGAVAVAFETIILGIVSFYSGHHAAMYVAEVMYWVAAALSLFVACGGVFFMYQPLAGADKMVETRNAIEDIWGERKPYKHVWPDRVDQFTIEDPEKWVQSARVMCRLFGSCLHNVILLIYFAAMGVD